MPAAEAGDAGLPDETKGTSDASHSPTTGSSDAAPAQESAGWGTSSAGAPDAAPAQQPAAWGTSSAGAPDAAPAQQPAAWGTTSAGSPDPAPAQQPAAWSTTSGASLPQAKSPLWKRKPVPLLLAAASALVVVAALQGGGGKEEESILNDGFYAATQLCVPGNVEQWLPATPDTTALPDAPAEAVRTYTSRSGLVVTFAKLGDGGLTVVCPDGSRKTT